VRILHGSHNWVDDVLYEIQMWALAIVKAVPGRLGCAVRNIALPYRHGRRVTVWDAVHIDHARRLLIGDNVSINRGSILNATGGITVGSDVLIGPRVIVYSQSHRYDGPGPITAQGYSTDSVTIEDGVWLAANVTVLPGVTIGRGTVVGAGAVVTESLPANVLAAGVPARVIKALGNIDLAGSHLVSDRQGTE
jgi:maltose O-acetyltransferase